MSAAVSRRVAFGALVAATAGLASTALVAQALPPFRMTSLAVRASGEMPDAVLDVLWPDRR